ncbi:MAG: AAC(3) family N-acetyltransferase [Planctomycetaceae bacterium]
MPTSYSEDDILKAYAALGISAGDTVYVVSELWRLRSFSGADIAGSHYNALRQLIGEEGTIVVSAATPSISNTETPFDPEMPSEMGIFSEYVRLLPGSRRSFHPFVSYAANGRLAEHITKDVSRHAYGPATPEARLIDLKATTISIGMKPNYSCSTGHHVELVMGVPFRYAKEFRHPVIRDGKMTAEFFYQHVWYRDIGFRKDRQVKLFETLQRDYNFKIRTCQLGAGKVYAYKIDQFFNLAIQALAHDIYITCVAPPEKRPYQS